MPRNNKGKGGSRLKRKANLPSARVRGGNTGMLGAPVGVSSDIQQYTKFSAGRSSDSLRMRSCAAICQVNRETSTTNGTGMAFPGGNNALSCQLNLTQPAVLSNGGTKVNVDFTSPVFDLIASAFVRYRVNGLKFHYEPQAAATTSERLVFAFAEDPMHPLLWNATVPTQSKLLALSDSIAFAPWRSWTMDVSRRLVDQSFYTFTDPSTTVASFAERFSDFGVISLVTSSVSQAQVSPCGVLYMEIDLELIEFCPISVTLPASKHLAARFSEENQEEEYSPPATAEKARS